MPTDMKYWGNLVKSNIEDIANEAFQRQEWFINAATSWYNPKEMFCKFFNDAGAEDFFTRNDTGLNQKQKTAGIHLTTLMDNLLKKYPHPDRDVEKLVDDPLMIESRKAAKDLLALLN